MELKAFNEKIKSVRQSKDLPIPFLKPDLSNLDEIRAFMDNAKYIRGFDFDVASGDNEFTQIQLTGEAQFLLGIKFFIVQEQPQNYQESTFRWLQNNDVVIDDSNITLYTSAGQYNIYLYEYFTLFRPLTGRDTFKLNINNPQDAYKLYLNIYYI